MLKLHRAAAEHLTQGQAAGDEAAERVAPGDPAAQIHRPGAAAPRHHPQSCRPACGEGARHHRAVCSSSMAAHAEPGSARDSSPMHPNLAAQMKYVSAAGVFWRLLCMMEALSQR